MKFITPISFLLILGTILGCSGVKSSWTDFRAHYNLYYNAEKEFESGLQKVEAHTTDIDPDRPARVHRAPPPVAGDEFEKAIEKTAEILRRHPGSKWTDDALLLMGKSYYFTGQYYRAADKFEELLSLTSNDRLKSEASLWRGRTYLEQKNYTGGIFFLLDEMDKDYLNTRDFARAELLLAELYAMKRNWEQSSSLLSGALRHLPDNSMKGRAYFLYGQVLEMQKRFGEALFAYGQVGSYYPEYEYVYRAELKRAEVAREEKNFSHALSILNSMSKNDKHYSRRDRIRYEMARTHEIRGEIQRAVEIYNDILHGPGNRPSSIVTANIYYRLGIIESRVHNHFSRAAAYFDSSSARADVLLSTENQADAQKLALAYDRYTRLKAEINRTDSLLWLSSLSAERLDSVLDEIRERQRAQISRRLQEEAGKNRISNINTSTGENSPDNRASIYGFLNYRNERLVRQSVNEFRVRWGSRPPVDHWRRMEVVRSTAITSSDEGTAPPVSDPQIEDAEDSKLELALDTGDIPRTDRQREKYRRRAASARYELGNLFLLNLQEPDSASAYFQEVIQRYPESPLVPQSMYSLVEAYLQSGNTRQAESWASSLIEEYPESRYAYQAAKRLNLPFSRHIRRDSSMVLRQAMELIEQMPDSQGVRKAEAYRKLALSNPSAELSSHIYFQAVKTYVDLARKHSREDRYRAFIQSYSEAGNWTVPTESKRDSSQQWHSSLYNAYWDSLQSVIDEYENAFDRSPSTYRRQIEALKQVLNSLKARKDGGE